MKYIIVLLALLGAPDSRAGGPSAEMKDALVESVEKMANGWTLIVTGPIEVEVADPKKPEQGTITTLYAKRARLEVLLGNYFYALKSQDPYEQRIKALVGKRKLIQMWGTIVTMDGGFVISVMAGDISLLRPTKEEAAFDLSRLMEIQSK